MQWQDLRRLVPSSRGGGGWGVPVIGDPINWMLHYGVQFDPSINNERQWTQTDTSHLDRGVPELPWGDGVLIAPCPFTLGKRRIETHMFFLGLDRFYGKPLTLETWRFLPRAHNAYAHCELYSKAAWCTETSASYRWYCMPIVPPLFSMDVDYETKAAQLPSEYDVALAVEIVPMYMFLHRIEGCCGDRYTGPKSLRLCRDVVTDEHPVVEQYRERRVVLEVHWPTISTHHRPQQLPINNSNEHGIAIAASLKLTA